MEFDQNAPWQPLRSGSRAGAVCSVSSCPAEQSKIRAIGCFSEYVHAFVRGVADDKQHPRGSSGPRHLRRNPFGPNCKLFRHWASAGYVLAGFLAADTAMGHSGT